MSVEPLLARCLPIRPQIRNPRKSVAILAQAILAQAFFSHFASRARSSWRLELFLRCCANEFGGCSFILGGYVVLDSVSYFIHYIFYRWLRNTTTLLPKFAYCGRHLMHTLRWRSRFVRTSGRSFWPNFTPIATTRRIAVCLDGIFTSPLGRTLSLVICCHLRITPLRGAGIGARVTCGMWSIPVVRRPV